MTVIIQLSAVGINITLFDIYSNIDYGTPIVTGISKMQLLAGYSLLNVPDNATTIRLSSTGTCSTYTDIAIGGLTTTTTTSTTAIPTTTTTSSTSTSTTSTSTTSTTSTTTSTTTAAPIQEYCVNWTAANIGGGKMSTQGYIDFTAILNGRTVAPTSCEGNVTGYIVDGVSYSCSIPMDFSVSPLATWDTDLLDAVTDKVLSSLIYTVYIEFTDSSYYQILNGQTTANVIPGQLTSSYNNCNVTTTTTTTAAPFNPAITLAYAGPAGTAQEACTAWNGGGNEVYYYVDDIWFIAYGLFQNLAMTIPAPASMYSDGNYSRYWDGSSFVGSPVAC